MSKQIFEQQKVYHRNKKRTGSQYVHYDVLIFIRTHINTPLKHTFTPEGKEIQNTKKANNRGNQ